jgi:hypothetical protein
MEVTTYTQASNYSQGLITLTPSAADVGSATGVVAVSDGVFSDQKSFGITVNPPNHPPVLTPPADMTVTQGSVAEQTVHATDADGDYIDFQTAPGAPSYMTAFTSDTNTGTIRLTPGPADVGTAQGTLRAVDGYGGVTDATFQITVLAGTFPPACPAGSPQFPRQHLAHFGRVADLNGDDVPDVVVGTYQVGNIDVYLGTGTGGLAPPPIIRRSSPSTSRSIQWRPHPGSRQRGVQPSSIGIRLGLGPDLRSAQSLLLSATPRRILTADFDRDGDSISSRPT